MGYNSVQKQVLEALLDQYERSKTYQGENKVIQSFQIPPEKVFPDYASDYADMDQIRDFEAWMRELEQDGLITIRYGSGEIRKLTADPERDVYKRQLQSTTEGVVKDHLIPHLYMCRHPLLSTCLLYTSRCV